MFASLLPYVKLKSNSFWFLFLIPQENKISRIEGKQVVTEWPKLITFPL